jgi:hypothetical protein
METVTTEQKQPVLKSLAIAGLLAVIIFIAWLAVQIVQVFPTAASSLASLANSVYNYNPTDDANLEMASGQTMVKTGESFTISWKEQKMKGVYAFTYTCQDGVSLNIVTSGASFTPAQCDTSYELGTETSLDITINSEKNRFTEVFYTINFFKTNATVPTGTYDGKVTVVNSNLFAEATTATTTAEVITEPEVVSTSTEPVVVVPEEPVVAVVEPVTPPVPPTPATTTTAVPVTPVVIAQPEYIYEIPVSQNDGEADLLVSFISLGIIDNNGDFIKTDSLVQGVTGALQISVHNIGNKTSEEWTFSAVLPGDIEFTSEDQKPLLPNERSLLTLQFKELNQISLEKYEVTVTTKADKNTTNNSIVGNAVVTAQ